MYHTKTNAAVVYFRSLLFLWILICTILRPQAASFGVIRGLQLCYTVAIPALFPFLVLSQLVVGSALAPILGWPLSFYTRRLHILNRSAGTALLLGAVGGYTSGVCAVNALLLRGQLTPAQAELLLCCAVNAGPGFVVSAVGLLLLKNRLAGILLFCALLFASLATGLIMSLLRRVFPAPRCAQTAKLLHTSSENSIPTAPSFQAQLRQSVHSMLQLCGCIVFFSFLQSTLLPPYTAPIVQFLFALGTEVTGACQIAVNTRLPHLLFCCCAALSVMGLSLFLQFRALLSPDVSLRPLVLSRLFHLPLACGALWVLLHLFPQGMQAATSTVAPLPLATHMPFDVIALAAFCIASLFVFIDRLKPAHHKEQSAERLLRSTQRKQ